LFFWSSGSNPRDRTQRWSRFPRAASDPDHTANERVLRSLRPPRIRWMVPSFKGGESDMNNLTSELSLGDLEAVSGGMRNQANDPGFHRTFATSFGTNNGSPLYGTGSFHDQIDNVDGLP
jgi:hypothetical protein